MKSVLKSVAFVLASALMTNTVQAADGNIWIKGSLFLQTCTISVGGVVSPAIATVTLPTVSDSLLNAAGKITGRTDFEIELSKCTGNANTAAVFFESGVDVDSYSGLLINRGTAINVRLQLLQNGAFGNVTIRAGDSQQLDDAYREPMSAGKAMLPYAVQYIATGITDAGSVRSSVTYTVIYQ